MPIYLVDMSLRTTEHDYAPLWEAMGRAQAQRLMDTNWLVDVAQDAAAVTRALLSHMAAGDKLFVLEFRPGLNWTGTGLDEDTKAWLGARLTGITKGLGDVPKPAPARPASRGRGSVTAAKPTRSRRKKA